MIEVLGLQQKRRALSHTLSGGQKRKLSVGIALIAGSKVDIMILTHICRVDGVGAENLLGLEFFI